MSESDVSMLAKESLSAGTFPSERKSSFRTWFDPQVHRAISDHASEDTSVEICGVLVGQWQKDEDGPFASISEYIRCDNATQGQAEVTFTHDSWNLINSEMDSKYSELRIIGWYHSHPDFGIFLSDRDIFIQQHFFGSPGQIALVVDPVRKLEGVFEWRAGRPELMDHYWVGNQIQSIAASRTSETPRGVNREAAAGSTRHIESAAAGKDAPIPWTVTLLSCLCMFLIGWMLSGSVNHSRAYQSWAIEKYGLWNILQIGRNHEIAEVQADISMLRGDVSELSSEHMKAADQDKEAAAALRKRWKEALTRISMSQKKLDRLQSLYGLSPKDEQFALSVVVDQLSRLRDSDRHMMLPIPVPERLYSMLATRLQTSEADPKKADSKKQDTTEKPGKTGKAASKPKTKAKTPAGPANINQ